eukprot:6198748-Pleurochrysis_carterae.AAC.1
MQNLVRSAREEGGGRARVRLSAQLASDRRGPSPAPPSSRSARSAPRAGAKEVEATRGTGSCEMIESKATRACEDKISSEWGPVDGSRNAGVLVHALELGEVIECSMHFIPSCTTCVCMLAEPWRDGMVFSAFERHGCALAVCLCAHAHANARAHTNAHAASSQTQTKTQTQIHRDEHRDTRTYIQRHRCI